MEELKVGMYVRTKKAPRIAKINKIVKNRDGSISFILDYPIIDLFENEIEKSSNNIIDLIEAEDVLKYIFDNKEYVSKVIDRGNKMLLVSSNFEVSLGLVEIKSIVKKEQFTSMEYKVVNEESNK